MWDDQIAAHRIGYWPAAAASGPVLIIHDCARWIWQEMARRHGLAMAESDGTADPSHFPPHPASNGTGRDQPPHRRSLTGSGLRRPPFGQTAPDGPPPFQGTLRVPNTGRAIRPGWRPSLALASSRLRKIDLAGHSRGQPASSPLSQVDQLPGPSRFGHIAAGSRRYRAIPADNVRACRAARASMAGGLAGAAQKASDILASSRLRKSDLAVNRLDLVPPSQVDRLAGRRTVDHVLADLGCATPLLQPTPRPAAPRRHR